MRTLEKEVREKILEQLGENTQQLAKNTEMLGSMVKIIIEK